MDKPILFSVVIPAYRCADALPELCRRLRETLSALDGRFEVILVDDASPAADWPAIRAAADADGRFKGVRLSRNFGQHYAITAGLEHAAGEWVVVMDGDLQDRPEEIPRLFAKAREGFDLVLAQRLERRDNLCKRLSSKAFYRVFGYLTGTVQDPSVANFGICHRRVIRAVLAMGDHVRYFPTMLQWVGFRRAYLPVAHEPRAGGRSAYTPGKLFRLAFDNIVAFSDKPLRLTVQLGMLICTLTAVLGIVFLVKYFRGEVTVTGWASLILSIWFLGGVVICLLGVIGLYLGKTFDRVKGRPLYLVQDRLNLDEPPPPRHGL